MTDVYACMVYKIDEKGNPIKAIEFGNMARFSYKIEEDITYEGAKIVFSVYNATDSSIMELSSLNEVLIKTWNYEKGDSSFLSSERRFHIDNFFPRSREAGAIRYLSFYGTELNYYRMKEKVNKQYVDQDKSQIIKDLLNSVGVEYNDANIDNLQGDKYDFTFINTSVIDIINFLDVKWTIVADFFVYLHKNLDENIYKIVFPQDINRTGIMISTSKQDYGTYEVCTNSGVSIRILSDVYSVVSDTPELPFGASNILVTHNTHWLNYDGSYMCRFVAVDKKNFGNILNDINYMREKTWLSGDYKQRKITEDYLKNNYPILVGKYNNNNKLEKIKYDLEIPNSNETISGRVKKIQPWIGDSGSITVPRETRSSTIIVRDINGQLYSIGEVDESTVEKEYVLIDHDTLIKLGKDASLGVARFGDSVRIDSAALITFLTGLDVGTLATRASAFLTAVTSGQHKGTIDSASSKVKAED
jgi:hypothetical protein